MPESKYHFEKLTPTDSIDLGVYEDAINYVFQNKDIQNVAISGAYSAGKSSVLASYEKKHSNLSFLHISLAHFKSSKEINKKDETKATESVLEGKILNQLIHQIPNERIPQTNFRVKKKTSSKSAKTMTFKAVLFIVSIIYFACFDIWKNFVNTLTDNWFKSILSILTHPYALIADGLLIVGLLFLIIYELIKVQKNKNIFHKLNIQGNEIEIFEKSDESYFDKYLNEVLYLFENAEADAIVFEDVDRFDANQIFERLHEVNTLANIQLKKDTKKTLRFFYLLRDDIFISKDRTKFFDYIIPVVPVVDSSNSYDQFISHFKKSGLLEKFDESFLQGLSLYIDDMRLLKNIYNEFLIYYIKLNIIELDCNKMLALIAYKNLFPRDFADLQLNQGFIYTVFSKKENFIKSEILKMEQDIREKQSRVASLSNEHLESIRELNAVFADRYLKDYNWTDKNDNQLSNFVPNYLNGDSLKEYRARKQNIEYKLEENSLHLSEEIKDLEKLVNEIKNKPLREIITRKNINEIVNVKSTNEIGDETNFNEIKGSEYFDLLKYLIRNGYIDETYADYMTYFYEHSLSRIDKTFLRSITDKNAKEYTYRLNNPELVLSRLKLVDFDQEETLNFDLFNHLLHTLSPIQYLEHLIDQLKSTKNFKFIGLYFDITNETPSYIKYLNLRWPEMFSITLKEHTLTEKQIRRYSLCSLYYCSDALINSINKDNCLRDYISNARDYLAIDMPNVDRLISCFILLGVKFIGFEYAELNKGLFFAVYENSLYEINEENLQLIQKEILGIKSNKDISQKNYTLLSRHSDSAITQYVNQNINEYFNVILKMCNGTICDDENIVVAVLNSTDLSKEHKYSYISVLQTTIESIKEIQDSSLWSLLLDVDVIKYSKQNIIDYFAVIKLDKSVIAYINKCNINLDFSELEDSSETKEALFDGVIVCNTIENSKYRQILVSLDFYYQDFTISDIDDDKISILIDTSIIRMTSKTLQFIRTNYPNKNLEFINKNIETYVGIMDSQLFSQKELLEILSLKINDDLKIELLGFSNDKISIIGMNYSSEICLYILNNNFMVSDLNDLFVTFEQWNEAIRAKIFDYAISYITIIIDNPNPVSGKLKSALLHSDNLNRNLKIDLLIAMMPTLNDSNIKENLVLLDLADYLKIYDIRSRPKFEINEENEKLLTAFKEKDLIYNYEECSEKAGYYKIIRTKPVTKSSPKELP